MNLVVSHEQADELQGVLHLALRELTHEIAATDNAGYRATLQDRRRLLTEVAQLIDRLLVVPEAATDTGEALQRELARPGG